MANIAETVSPIELNVTQSTVRRMPRGIARNCGDALRLGLLRGDDQSDQLHRIREEVEINPHAHARGLLTPTLLQQLPAEQKMRAEEFLEQPPFTVTAWDLISFLDDLLYEEPCHAFVSYVRENSEVIQKLSNALTAYGVKVWLDRNEIKPEFRFKDAIKDAIRGGAFFIACFSRESLQRTSTHMNEELTEAIDELHRRPPDRAWFISVLLPSGTVPNRRISGAETLRDLEWVSLSEEDWDAGIQRILSVARPNLRQ